MPAPRTPLLHVAEEPDRAWALHGRHFLHEARTYASWQPAGTRSAVRSAATTVEELRAEGVCRILTPEECAGLGHDTYVLHPPAGGMPVDEGWRSLRLFAEQVLPRQADESPGSRGAADGRPAGVRHTAAPARTGSGPGRRGYEERGSGDLNPSPRFMGRAGPEGARRHRPRGRGQPISSRALPFVSLTNFRTNGMESAANTV
ncbi:hypothetical protein SHIRM173S_02760 [Streptomyces hirsutus]